jgi:hypothetical protein
MPKKKKRVTSPRMQAFLDAKKHETVLIGSVDRHLQLLPNDRDATVIHPSEMVKKDWCPRATWHRLAGHKAKEATPIPLTLSAIFAEGTESGKKWQNWTRDMGILWGRWECRICEESVMEWSSDLTTLPCPNRMDGYPHLWKYKEVPFRNGLIGGHADGIVNPTGDESLVMENKTIGPGTLRMLGVLAEDEEDELSSTKFGRVTAVLPSHFRQTQIYLRLANSQYHGELGPITRGVIIYEHKADQQIREFVVEYDPRWTDHIWDMAKDIEWQISMGREVKCPYGGCPGCREYEEH